MRITNLELSSFKSLSKFPIGWHYIVAGHGLAIAGGDLEGYALTNQFGVALPVLAPVPSHGFPPCPGSFNGDGSDIPCTTHIRYQYQDEVGVAVHGEPYASLHSTRNPSVQYRNYPSLILRDLQEGRLRQVEVLERGVAPPTVVIRFTRVRRTVVGSSHGDGACDAPLSVVGALQLITRPAAVPIVE